MGTADLPLHRGAESLPGARCAALGDGEDHDHRGPGDDQRPGAGLACRPPHRVEQRLVLGQALVVRHHQDPVGALEVVAERLGAVERPFLVRAGEQLVDQVAVRQAPVVLGGASPTRELHRQHRRAVLERDAVLGPGGPLVAEHEHAVGVTAAGAGGG